MIRSIEIKLTNLEDEIRKERKEMLSKTKDAIADMGKLSYITDDSRDGEYLENISNFLDNLKDYFE